MKIALVLDDSLDRPDGVQQYVLTIGGFLAAQGHDVHYVCSTTARTDIPNVHSLARNLGVTFNGNKLRVPLPTSRRKLRAFVAEQAFDVIHVQTPHSPLFGARVVDAARRVHGAAVTVVGTFHILPDGWLSSAGTRALGLLLRRNLRKFDRFCAVSAPAVAFSRRSFGIDPVVIPCAIDVPSFARAAAKKRPARKPGGPLVLSFLGRLVERKGAEELVEALALLPQPLLDRLEVRIGGKGPLGPALGKRVRELGLADHVEFAGFVSEEVKAQFYADSDVAVFPATGGESFGIVLIEAMASGAGAVLGGDNPGYLSVLGDAPEVSVDARDPRAFAAALVALLEDDAARASVGAEQAERVKQFDVAAVGAQIESLYRG